MGLYKVSKILFFSIFIYLTGASFLNASNIKDRFGSAKKLSYKVYFNGVPVGNIYWEYLGNDKINEEDVDVIGVKTDAHILEFLNIETSEKIFLNSKTYLPLRVERNVSVFGGKEVIEEIYNQDEGSVKITHSNSKKREEVLHPGTPINNILALLYFFPKDVKLNLKETLYFNLPTQKVTVRLLSLKNISTPYGKKKVYYLMGRGKRKFRLWLDIVDRLPYRIDFPLTIGKIYIVRKK